jgi:hypothetical protein
VIDAALVVAMGAVLTMPQTGEIEAPEFATEMEMARTAGKLTAKEAIDAERPGKRPEGTGVPSAGLSAHGRSAP